MTFCWMTAVHFARVSLTVSAVDHVSTRSNVLTSGILNEFFRELSPSEAEHVISVTRDDTDSTICNNNKPDVVKLGDHWGSPATRAHLHQLIYSIKKHHSSQAPTEIVLVRQLPSVDGAHHNCSWVREELEELDILEYYECVDITVPAMLDVYNTSEIITAKKAKFLEPVFEFCPYSTQGATVVDADEVMTMTTWVEN